MIDKKRGKVWWIRNKFVSLRRVLHIKYKLEMEKNIVNKLNKDEVIRRFQQSKQRKQDRLKELEEGLRTDFRNVTGMEAKTFVVW